MYKRVLLKLSGEALAGGQGKGFDPETLKSLALQLKAVAESGVELAIVVGGGNFVRGNLISGSSAFSKTSLNIREFTVHVLLKSGLENFENYFTSM